MGIVGIRKKIEEDPRSLAIDIVEKFPSFVAA
jgi:hypothetical protein